jgi:hypothetical protein
MTKLCVSHPVPSCVTCGSPAVPIRHYYDQDRNRTATSYRRYCSKCHGTRTAKKHGFKRLSQIAAHRAGQTETQYKNKWHPHLKYRKNYCENQDGRLGFVCNTRLPTKKMLAAANVTLLPEQFLEVDHIDSNHKNNDPSNLQTLCNCCHKIKGIQNGDHLTPGRKTRKSA